MGQTIAESIWEEGRTKGLSEGRSEGQLELARRLLRQLLTIDSASVPRRGGSSVRELQGAQKAAGSDSTALRSSTATRWGVRARTLFSARRTWRRIGRLIGPCCQQGAAMQCGKGWVREQPAEH